MLNKLKENPKIKTLNSYIGLIKHGNTQKVKNKVLKELEVGKHL